MATKPPTSIVKHAFGNGLYLFIGSWGMVYDYFTHIVHDFTWIQSDTTINMDLTSKKVLPMPPYILQSRILSS